MHITKTFYAKTRAEWRKWLKANYKKEKEIWLIYYKKSTGKPRVDYNDAVEEAICFGWIDGQAKGINKESFAQRYTPRRPKSPYSQMNKERLRHMIEMKKVAPEILAVAEKAFGDAFVFPKDILRAIEKNPKAWEHFEKFSDRYKRIRLSYIDGARKRPDEFKKRLNNFIKATEKNKQFGFGGTEHYF